jgi:CheY-like chemotaxis protein/HPt (histidine-containing phosphotransfer) domain-containing protein
MIRDLLTFGRGAPRAVIPVIEPARRKTVLIVDDCADSLHAMCLALAGEKCRVETADTAGKALRRVAASHPELILVDVRVLAPDGARLAQRLLADEELAPVPIVALTQMGPGTQGADCPIGAYDGHIPKNTDGGVFAGQVRVFLRSSTQPPPAAVNLEIPYGAAIYRRPEAAKLLDSIEEGLPDSQFAPGARAALQQLARVVKGFENSELADYLQRAERLSNASTVRGRSRYRLIIGLCREITGRDPESAPEMAALRAGYLDRRQAEVLVLSRALQEGDFAAILKAGHNLKGTGMAYGFAEISDIGRALEAAAKGADAGAIKILLDQIDSYVELVRPSDNTGDMNVSPI